MLGTWMPGAKVIGSASGESDTVIPGPIDDGPHWSDLIDPLRSRLYYVCVVTGDADGLPDYVMEPSSWQATVQTGRAQYCQAVIPAVDAHVDAISARPNGDLVIRSGAIFDDGSTQEQEMVRVPLSTPNYDYGPRRRTGRLSGYGAASPQASASITRHLTGVRSLSFGAGGARARADVDWGLRPGNRAIADGVDILVAYINYYVIGRNNGVEAYMDVGERDG